VIASGEQRIGIVGLGAMGQQVLRRLCAEPLGNTSLAVLTRYRATTKPLVAQVEVFDELEALLRWKPHLVVECAGHDAVINVVPLLLAHGVDVVLASVGALADPELRATLQVASGKGRAMLSYVAGAIGGLDVISAARNASLQRVTYIGRKPPSAWAGSVAEQTCELQTLRVPVSIFKGSAVDAARLYPKNANVAAAVALAGVGFEATQVELVADPSVSGNVHEVEAVGAFGRFVLRLENEPLPDNPKTSWLAALSIEDAVRRKNVYPVFPT
jgi:aspartate dehydrogenase